MEERKDEYVLDDSFEFENDNENKVRYAGFWVRTGASILDSLIMAPVVGISFYNIVSIKSLPLQILLLLLTAAYKPFMEYKYSATLGKMAVNVKVVDLKFNGISVNQAFIRYIPWFAVNVVGLMSTVMLFVNHDVEYVNSFLDFANIDKSGALSSLEGITSFFMIISCIVVATNEQKQGLHDKMAKTYCVYKD